MTISLVPASSIDEDEIFAILYQREASLAKEFPHLTTDNYQEFMDKSGLVVFYLKCEKEGERGRERGRG